MADEIVVKYVADVNGFKAEMKSTQDAIKATATEAEIAGASTTESFKKAEKSTQSLRSQLKNLKAELAVATDPKDIERLARAAGDITDKLDDATQAAKIFASESKFEQIRTALGGIGRSVASLDFKQAAQQAKLLQSAVASLTFKEAIGGLKNLGSTFVSIGKTLLVNPIFLIAATVTAIGVAVFALKDKIPFLTKAFDAVSEAVKRVKNFITGITDSLGFTTVATDKAFDRLIQLGKEVDEQREIKKKYQEEELERQKKIAEEQKKITQESIETYKVQHDQQTEIIKEATKKREDDIKKIKDKADKEAKDAADKKLQEDKDRIELFTNAYEANKAREAEVFNKQMDEEIAALERADELRWQLAQQTSDAIFGLYKQSEQNIVDEKQLNADKEKQINADKVAQGLLTAEEAAAKNKLIDDSVAKARNELAVKQAKADKAQAIFNIGLSTAQAIIKQLATTPLPVGAPLVALVAGIGAVQLAAAIAKPIPKFAKGTDRVRGGVVGQDSVPALLMPDEAVIQANKNMAVPGLAKAWNEGKLEEYINKNFVLPKISELLSSSGSTAERMAASAKINFPDEYALGRVMSRNKGVQIENADYLANKIAKSLSNVQTKRGWA